MVTFSVTSPVSSDDLEWRWKGGRWGGQFFFRRISIRTIVPFDQERPNSAW